MRPNRYEPDAQACQMRAFMAEELRAWRRMHAPHRGCEELSVPARDRLKMFHHGMKILFLRMFGGNKCNPAHPKGKNLEAA